MTTLTRNYGPIREYVSSFDARSVVHDGVQLPAIVIDVVLDPTLYAKSDTFEQLMAAQSAGQPASTSRPLTIGSLQLPGAEITLANKAGYAVVYQQGFFYVQLIGDDPVLLEQLAEVLVATNARRQP